MSVRRMWLADHRGRDAIVVLISRRREERGEDRENDAAPLPPVRVIKATAETCAAALRKRFPGADLAQVLIGGDPEIAMEAIGLATGACDRVYVDAEGKPLYAAHFVDIAYDAQGQELGRREPLDTPANLVPERRPVWSGKLVSVAEVVQRYVFTRAYQVRHTNALEYEFLHGLAAHLEKLQSVAVVGSGPRGVGPLICERNGTPMKGILSGRTRGDKYRLVLHLAAFELRVPEEVP